MTDKLDDILKRIEEGQKWIVEQHLRDILAYDLETAYMFATINNRYLKKNQEETK